MFFLGAKQRSTPTPEQIVRSVEQPPPKPVKRWLLIFWAAIGLKCFLVILAHGRTSAAPRIAPEWIVIPTLLSAGLVTWLLLRRRL